MFSLLLHCLKNWKISALASLVTGISATIYIQHLEIRHDRRAIIIAKAQYGILKESNTQLIAALDRQNHAVAALALQSREKETQASLLIAQSKRNAARYDATANVTAHMQTQKNGDDCATLGSIIDSYTQLAKRENF